MLSTLVVALLVLVFALVAGAAGWLVWRLWTGASTVPADGAAAGAVVADPAEES